MADEFVDFYEALNLPVDAERTAVRQRINELYLEAQRNLDHRNFQTRIEYQRIFEVVLPRARYILLDDTRRNDYDALVRAFRGPSTPAPAPQTPIKQSFGPGDASSFKLAEVEEAAGKAPPIEALPKSPLDVEKMAVQRDEMWAKWKAGLEAAIARDESEAQTAKPAPAPRPTPVQPAVSSPAPTVSEAPRKGRPNAAAISFNFDNGSSNTTDDEESARATAFEIERQRTERKRVIMKEILDNVSLKGALIGGFGSAIPLGAILISLMGRFYPRDAAPKIALPSGAAWLLGLIIIAGVVYLVSSEMAKSMRHQASIKYAALPLEELLRQLGRSY